MSSRKVGQSPRIKKAGPGLKIAIVYRPIDELEPNPLNPRVHSKKQIKRIAAGMTEFGNITPILIDGAGQVIAGHARLLAARENGWTEVPTIMVEHLTKAQGQAFMIADNRLAELAAWDMKLVGENLKALSELNLDFSLELTGFETPEIDSLILNLDAGLASEPDPADEVAAPSGPRVSKPGDLYELDRNRLYCGDAL